MKEKKNIVMLIIIILLFIVSGILLYFVINKNDCECNCETTKISKKKYYNSMIKTMDAYYKIYIKDLNISEENKTKPVKVYLYQLENRGFPMESFVSYDNKEKCDDKKSYAVRTIKNNKYIVKVYYKCGNDTNYKISSNKTLTTTKLEKQG